MKNKLPCAIVRDLLPSYVDKLTEEETTLAVKEHLEHCPQCLHQYETMLEGEENRDSDVKEIDFLKTVRKMNRKKIIMAIVISIVIVLAMFSIKLFLIGNEADSDGVSFQMTPVNNADEMRVSFLNMDSANALKDLHVETINDVIEITGRKVLVSPIHPSEELAVTLNLSGMKEVRAFGKTIWKNGVVIEEYTQWLWKNQVTYVGDAPSVNNLISNMNLDALHTLEIQSGEEPYGVVIHFTEEISKNRREMLKDHACVILSLVGNLGEVSWDDPSGYTDHITLKEAGDIVNEKAEEFSKDINEQIIFHENIKDYSADVYELQVLMNILGL